MRERESERERERRERERGREREGGRRDKGESESVSLLKCHKSSAMSQNGATMKIFISLLFWSLGHDCFKINLEQK